MVLEIQFWSVKNSFYQDTQKFWAVFYFYPSDIAKMKSNRTNFKHLQYSCDHTIFKVDASQSLDMTEKCIRYGYSEKIILTRMLVYFDLTPRQLTISRDIHQLEVDDIFSLGTVWCCQGNKNFLEWFIITGLVLCYFMLYHGQRFLNVGVNKEYKEKAPFMLFSKDNIFFGFSVK